MVVEPQQQADWFPQSRWIYTRGRKAVVTNQQAQVTGRRTHPREPERCRNNGLTAGDAGTEVELGREGMSGDRLPASNDWEPPRWTGRVSNPFDNIDGARDSMGFCGLKNATGSEG